MISNISSIWPDVYWRKPASEAHGERKRINLDKETDVHKGKTMERDTRSKWPSARREAWTDTLCSALRGNQPYWHFNFRLLAPGIMQKWDLVTKFTVFQRKDSLESQTPVLCVLESFQIYSGFSLLFLSPKDISGEYSRATDWLPRPGDNCYSSAKGRQEHEWQTNAISPRCLEHTHPAYVSCGAERWIREGILNRLSTSFQNTASYNESGWVILDWQALTVSKNLSLRMYAGIKKQRKTYFLHS